MSFDQNANPYRPTSFSAEPSSSGVRRPLQGYAKVACIFFIILGSLGLLQFLGTIAQFVIAAVAPQQGQVDPNSIFPGAMIIAGIVALVNAAVSVAEIVGGVFGLQQKSRGANLIRNISIFMVIWKLIETLYGVVVGYLVTGLIKDQVLEQMQNQPNPPPMDMGPVVEIGMFIGLAVAAIFGLTMLLFYLFTYLYFRKPQTIAQFS